jgi:hypothetical protein
MTYVRFDPKRYADEPQGPPLPHIAMTPDAFTASLEQSAARHPPSKARRIAALLPQIEAAMSQGSPRAHIVSALMGIGIDITPHQLSNVIARLRKQRLDAAPLPAVRPSGVPIGSVPTLAHLPNPASPSKFGAHDPRLLDEVMRSTPDMKALAKLAPKGKP